MLSIALAGKPNTGKSTFFKSSTLIDVAIASYPFTTKDANHGVSYVRSRCPCGELGVRETCEKCSSGERLIPIELIDVAGLVPDAHKGRGLGNEFLDHLRRANAIINVVDTSGATDGEGNLIGVGLHDPTEDVRMFETEFSMWLCGILEKKWRQSSKKAAAEKTKIERVIAEQLAGIGVTEAHAKQAVLSSGLDPERADRWSQSDLASLANLLRVESKPMLIAANKLDVAPEGNLEKLKGFGYTVIPCSAEAELALRSAAKNRLINYTPGDRDFEVIATLSAKQRDALEKIRVLMKKFKGTGVQECINHAVFKLLSQIVVYPVEDENKFCDSKGVTLPDAILLPSGSTPRQLAFAVHSDLGEGFLYAVDARTKMRLGEKYEMKNGDAIKIVSSC